MSSETASRGCSPCRITRSMRPLSVLVLSTVGPNRSSRRKGEGVQKSRRFPACQRVFLANAGVGVETERVELVFHFETIEMRSRIVRVGRDMAPATGLTRSRASERPGRFDRNLIRWGLVAKLFSSQRSLWSSDKGHVGDVLASRGDEGRGRLRKAWGSCQTSI